MGMNDGTVFVSVSYFFLKPILSKNVYPFWHLWRMSYCYRGDCMYTFPGNNNTCVELLMTKKVTLLKDIKMNLWVVQCMKMYIIFFTIGQNDLTKMGWNGKFDLRCYGVFFGRIYYTSPKPTKISDGINVMQISLTCVDGFYGVRLTWSHWCLALSWQKAQFRHCQNSFLDGRQWEEAWCLLMERSQVKMEGEGDEDARDSVLFPSS